MPKLPMFNFRVDDDLMVAIDEAAEAAHLTKSAWAREVIAAVAYGVVTLDDLKALVDARGAGVLAPSPHPKTRLMPTTREQRAMEKKGCLHPETARQVLPFSTVCVLCGASV